MGSRVVTLPLTLLIRGLAELGQISYLLIEFGDFGSELFVLSFQLFDFEVFLVSFELETGFLLAKLGDLVLKNLGLALEVLDLVHASKL